MTTWSARGIVSISPADYSVVSFLYTYPPWPSCPCSLSDIYTLIFSFFPRETSPSFLGRARSRLDSTCSQSLPNPTWLFAYHLIPNPFIIAQLSLSFFPLLHTPFIALLFSSRASLLFFFFFFYVFITPVEWRTGLVVDFW